MKSAKRDSARAFRLVDLCVVLFFLSTAAFSLNLFRLDLMQTLDSRDEDPVGIIIIRNNVVQRRYADRVLWDRLFVDSPVYSGDLIRAADNSAATVIIDSNGLELNENTLIRIQFALDRRGPFQVELKEGNLGVTTSLEGSPLMLSLLGGIEVQPGPGTVLSAASGEDGIEVQINEGTVTLTKEGSSRELVEGMMIAQDASGYERIEPSVVVKSPIQNARYLKDKPEPVPVNFIWNRINLEAEESIRLEISGDRYFLRNLQVIDGLYNQTQVSFEPGLWFWRISYGNIALRTGQLTIADASGPVLQSPVMNSVFRYHDALPTLRFQWSEKLDASHYIIEISETPEFISPRISRKVASASYISSNLGQGTWYWRVQPVFPSVYEGVAIYSSTASFRIEQSSDPHAPVIELPVPVSSATGSAVAGQKYIVQAGDTLGLISAQAYGTASGWVKIIQANNIDDPNMIFPGDVLFIPPEN
jgi:LysM repeat protein